jgi:fatty acid desaturase
MPLRAYLLAEHPGCTEDRNGLTNTRTTLTNPLVRLLMWNMPFHAEHHLYPTIPFHRLPEAHAAIGSKLGVVQRGYLRWNVALASSFVAPSHGEPLADECRDSQRIFNADKKGMDVDARGYLIK